MWCGSVLRKLRKPKRQDKNGVVSGEKLKYGLRNWCCYSNNLFLHDSGMDTDMAACFTLKQINLSSSLFLPRWHCFLLSLSLSLLWKVDMSNTTSFFFELGNSWNSEVSLTNKPSFPCAEICLSRATTARLVWNHKALNDKSNLSLHRVQLRWMFRMNCIGITQELVLPLVRNYHWARARVCVCVSAEPGWWVSDIPEPACWVRVGFGLSTHNEWD